jgi:hypothetical protein
LKLCHFWTLEQQREQKRQHRGSRGAHKAREAAETCSSKMVFLGRWFFEYGFSAKVDDLWWSVCLVVHDQI